MEEFLVSKQEWVEFFGNRDIISKEEWQKFIQIRGKINV